MTDDSSVSEDDVRHVAELARVDVTDDEVTRFVEQFAEVLGYYDQLSDVPSVDEDMELSNIVRPDTPRECLSNEEATRNATTDEDGFFEAPSVQEDS